MADIQHVYRAFFSVFIGQYVRCYKGKRRTCCSKRRTCPDVRRVFIYTADPPDKHLHPGLPPPPARPLYITTLPYSTPLPPPIAQDLNKPPQIIPSWQSIPLPPLFSYSSPFLLPFLFNSIYFSLLLCPFSAPLAFMTATIWPAPHLPQAITHNTILVHFSPPAPVGSPLRNGILFVFQACSLTISKSLFNRELLPLLWGSRRHKRIA